MELKSRLKRLVFRLGVLSLPISTVLCSCSDNIDDSNLYSFTGDLASTYLEKTPDFTSYSLILKKAKLSSKSQSTVYDLLAARGNYTCFAPTNEAIQIYLDSIFQTKGYDVNQCPDSIAEDIAKNSIIDNGDEDAYFVRNFEGTSLEKKTLADRFITLDFVTEGSKAVPVLNTSSKVILADNEVENGVIHGIDHVLAPSNAYLPTLISETPSIRVFSKLLEVTGWDEKMMEFRDMEYEEKQPQTWTDTDGTVIEAPSKRNKGYTAFVETDQLFYDKGWISEMPQYENNDIANWATIYADIQNKLREFVASEKSKAPNGEYEGVYLDESDDPKNENNIVNQFVSYHLLPFRVVYDKLVIHYVEMGYGYSTPSVKSINCHEYYETMGNQRRILKFTDGERTGGVRINRYVSQYNRDTYNEEVVPDSGILVKAPSSEVVNDALNGNFFLIDDILTYGQNVPNEVLNERMRYDVTSLLPELMTNDIRRPYSGTLKYSFLPTGYCDNLIYDDETFYKYGPQWPANYQCDEHNAVGNYDVYLKLPPVPYTGTYELRWCIPIFPNRGMMQVYLGTDRANLPAIGLPLDLRMEASNPLIGWEADTDDEEYNTTVDKNMRNHGYMKPPAHDGSARSGNPVTVSMRESTSYQRIRKILWTGTVRPTDEIWVRMKTVLDNPNTMLVLDFLEWCPRTVYNNKAVPEDKW